MGLRLRSLETPRRARPRGSSRARDAPCASTPRHPRPGAGPHRAAGPHRRDPASPGQPLLVRPAGLMGMMPRAALRELGDRLGRTSSGQGRTDALRAAPWLAPASAPFPRARRPTTHSLLRPGNYPWSISPPSQPVCRIVHHLNKRRAGRGRRQRSRKSESASPRRLEQAREEGQVPHSRELATFISLMVGRRPVRAGRWGGHRMMALCEDRAQPAPQPGLRARRHGADARNLATDALLTVAPLLHRHGDRRPGHPFLVGGWVFHQALQVRPHPPRPFRGLGCMFSTHGLVGAGQGHPQGRCWWPASGVGGWRERDHLFCADAPALATSMDDFARLVLLSALLIVANLALIAAIDVPLPAVGIPPPPAHDRTRCARK